MEGNFEIVLDVGYSAAAPCSAYVVVVFVAEQHDERHLQAQVLGQDSMATLPAFELAEHHWTLLAESEDCWASAQLQPCEGVTDEVYSVQEQRDGRFRWVAQSGERDRSEELDHVVVASHWGELVAAELHFFGELVLPDAVSVCLHKFG